MITPRLQRGYNKNMKKKVRVHNDHQTPFHTLPFIFRSDERYLWILNCLLDEIKETPRKFTDWEKNFVSSVSQFYLEKNRLFYNQRVKLEQIYKERQ